MAKNDYGLTNKNTGEGMTDEAPVSVFTGAKIIQERKDMYDQLEEELNDSQKTDDEKSVDRQFKINGRQH